MTPDDSLFTVDELHNIAVATKNMWKTMVLGNSSVGKSLIMIEAKCEARIAELKAKKASPAVTPATPKDGAAVAAGVPVAAAAVPEGEVKP